MDPRPLGQTDLSLSPIALGTWGLAAASYGPVDPIRFEETLRTALDRGITTFDCAPLWGDGEGERRVGAAVAGRDDVVLVTRAGVRRVEGRVQRSFDDEDLVRDLEGSLRRFGREAVDLWLLHNPGRDVLLRDEWRETVDRLEAEGKIRHWGVAVGEAEEARLALSAGARALCLTYNLLQTEELGDVGLEIDEAGCGVLARSPLAYGLLGGQWSEHRRFDDADHRSRRWNEYAFRERVRQVGQLRFLVGPTHGDLATAALRYVLSSPRVTSALVGCRSPYHAISAAAAAEAPGRLSDADLRRLAKVRDAAGF